MQYIHMENFLSVNNNAAKRDNWLLPVTLARKQQSFCLDMTCKTGAAAAWQCQPTKKMKSPSQKYITTEAFNITHVV